MEKLKAFIRSHKVETGVTVGLVAVVLALTLAMCSWQSQSVDGPVSQPPQTSTSTSENITQEPTNSKDPVTDNPQTQEPQESSEASGEPTQSVDPESSSAPTDLSPRSITVKIDSKVSTYGDPKVPLTYTVLGGKLDRGDPKISLWIEPTGTTVGTYKIVGKSMNAAYKVSFIYGTYQINQRPLTVAINSFSSKVGDQLSPLTFQILEGSLADGDKAEDVINLSTNADSKKVGSYRIEGAAINNNYKVTFVVGTYQITDGTQKTANLVVKIDNKTSVYGETMKELTYTIKEGELTNGDLLIVLTREEGKNAGTYKITGVCNNSAYNVTFENEGTYTITKRPITVKIDSKTSRKGETLHKLTGRIIKGSLAEGDKAEKVFSFSTNAKKDQLGTYTIEGKVLSDNYQVTFLKGIYLVEKQTSNEDENQDVTTTNPPTTQPPTTQPPTTQPPTTQPPTTQPPASQLPALPDEGNGDEGPGGTGGNGGNSGSTGANPSASVPPVASDPPASQLPALPSEGDGDDGPGGSGGNGGNSGSTGAT